MQVSLACKCSCKCLFIAPEKPGPLDFLLLGLLLIYSIQPFRARGNSFQSNIHRHIIAYCKQDAFVQRPPSSRAIRSFRTKTALKHTRIFESKKAKTEMKYCMRPASHHAPSDVVTFKRSLQIGLSCICEHALPEVEKGLMAQLTRVVWPTFAYVVFDLKIPAVLVQISLT